MKKILALIIVLCGMCMAHSGGTNSDGCHNDYIHGGYHCHNSKNVYQSSWYITNPTDSTACTHYYDNSYYYCTRHNSSDIYFTYTRVNATYVNSNESVSIDIVEMSTQRGLAGNETKYEFVLKNGQILTFYVNDNDKYDAATYSFDTVSANIATWLSSVVDLHNYVIEKWAVAHR